MLRPFRLRVQQGIHVRFMRHVAHFQTQPLETFVYRTRAFRDLEAEPVAIRYNNFQSVQAHDLEPEIAEQWRRLARRALADSGRPDSIA